jgi:AraC-like DNA-binding protein
LRLSEAAQLVHLSEGAFSRFFKTHTGKTFPCFVNELRIGRACRLLTETDETITEIAYGCGFANLSNFNRQFLRLRGMSPRSFRQEIKQRLPAG